ncbi:ADOP family duplicated permease [Acidicapsa dinghuensis]|uniref:ADOP family duplicated permease n=1 Tax=Acidicapsa dinghuensis TaxID=2218256 RepID=A0ABW1EJB0_9BACT|nr:ABC transporter permease [Acidicapsa dinghuensis]
MPILRRLANLFRRDKLQREIEAELAAHLAMRSEDNRAAGMSPREARRNAQLRFGNSASLTEKTMQADTALFLESLWLDTRFAMRQLRKSPGFAVIAVLMIAIGLGAATAIFAFVDAALIQPMPYKDPARLAAVYEVAEGCPLCNLSRQNWQDWRQTNTVFESFQAWGWASYLLRNSEGTTEARGARVSDGFFHTLGVIPVLGRDFYAGEEKPGATRTVLLSYSAWQKRFGSNPGVVGQSVRLSDNDYTIIGVLPREFHFAPLGEADFWTALNDLDSCEQRRGCHNLFGVARLKPGVTVAAAADAMRTMAAQLVVQYPDSNKGLSATAISLNDAIVGNMRPLLIALLCGSALLWIIASVNVISLLLIRSEGRRQEIAVRGALGASSGRLAWQFLLESFVLVTCGAACGIALAEITIRSMLHLIPTGRMDAMPYLLGLGLHSHAILFAASLACVSIIVCSLAPATRLASTFGGGSLHSGLAAGARGASGNTWRKLGARLVVVEVATAVILLAAAGLLGKSLFNLLHVDLGMQPDHLATLVVSAPKQVETDAQMMGLLRSLVDRVQSLPGVTRASVSSHLPDHDWDGGVMLVKPDDPPDKVPAPLPERDVSSSYLHTIGAQLLRGRYFTQEEDDASKPAIAIVNESLAKLYFPGQDPIGKRLAYMHSKNFMQIVGVVKDVKEGQMDTATRPVVYVPYMQGWSHSFYLVVRTATDAGAQLPTITAAVHGLNPLLATSDPVTMMTLINDSPSAYLHRSSAWVVGGFATLALLLSAVGLYGVIAYSVSQRRREIGVRMALGARRESVCYLVLREAGMLAAVGIAFGVIGSLCSATLIRSLLFGTQPWDVTTLLAVALLLAVCAFVASYIPARRAASLNPIEALRTE